MQVIVKDNSGSVKRDITVKANIFLRLVADEVVTVATPNTPKDKGNLRQDILKQVLGLTGKITWGKNYAVYQERGYSSGQIKNYTTAGTGAHFAANAIKAVYDRAQELMKKAGLI